MLHQVQDSAVAIFVMVKKENGPELFAHNIEQAFEPHHLTPEKKKGEHLQN
jgi:hypothetical protein